MSELTQEEIDAMSDDDLTFEIEDDEGRDDRLVALAVARASSMDDLTLLGVGLFEDDAESSVLDSRIVRGRKEHRDHYSGNPIPTGARHRVQRESSEGQFITTRHSELSLFLLMHGSDPSVFMERAA